MKRIFAAAALALATGCRGPSQVYDPFLGDDGRPAGHRQPAAGAAVSTAHSRPLPATIAPVPRPRRCRAMARRISRPLRPADRDCRRASRPTFRPLSPFRRRREKPARCRLHRFPIQAGPPIRRREAQAPKSQFSPGIGSPTLAQAGSTATAQSNPPVALDVDRILAARGTSASTSATTGGATGSTIADSNPTTRSNGATPVAFSSPGSTIRIVEPASSPGTLSHSGDLGNASSSSPLSSTTGLPRDVSARRAHVGHHAGVCGKFNAYSIGFRRLRHGVDGRGFQSRSRNQRVAASNQPCACDRLGAEKRRYPRNHASWRYLGESDFECCSRSKRRRGRRNIESWRQPQHIHKRQRLRLCIRFAVSIAERQAGILTKHARVAATIYSARRQLDR